MTMHDHDYPEGTRTPRDEVKKVGSRFMLAVDDLTRMEDPAQMEDAIWAKLDRDIEQHMDREGYRRIRGIEHTWFVKDMSGTDYKEYRAFTVAVPK